MGSVCGIGLSIVVLYIPCSFFDRPRMDSGSVTGGGREVHVAEKEIFLNFWLLPIESEKSLIYYITNLLDTAQRLHIANCKGIS